MRTVILLLFFAAVALKTEAQEPFKKDLWVNEAGTAIRVSDMALDDLGSLWLATDLGLCRYNGRSIQQIPDSGIKSATAIAVVDRQVYVGLGDGRVLRYTGSKFEQLVNAGARINCLYNGPFGLWIGTAGNGAMLLTQGRVLRLTTAQGLSDDYVYRFAYSKVLGKLAIGTDRGATIIGLNQGPKPTLELNYSASSAPVSTDITPSLFWSLGKQSLLLTGTAEHGVGSFRLSATGVREADSTMALWIWGTVNDLLPISGSQAWACTESGYIVLVDFSRGTYQEVHQLPGKRIFRLLRDRTGTIWAATSEGLTMLSIGSLYYFSPESGYQLTGLSAMASDGDVLWYAQESALYSCDSSHKATLRYNAPETITSLYFDPGHRLWIGTLGGGLFCRSSAGNVRQVRGVPNLEGGHILSIAGKGSLIWVASLNGVEELMLDAADISNPRIVRHHGKRTGMGSDYVYKLYPDRKGRLWMATDGAGIALWNGSEYYHWDTSSGFRPQVVYAIAEDHAGRIYAGSLEGGILSWDGSKWNSIGREQGLLDNTVLSLAALGDGSVLAVTEKGADHWYPGSREFRQYGRKLGFGIDSFSHALNLLATNNRGEAYLPFEHGIMLVKPAPNPPDLRPLISIHAVELFGKAMDSSRHELSPDENGIGFRYEGVQLVSPERLHYRYRLLGFSKDWVETADESAIFPRLPAGHYVFQVQASLTPGYKNAATAQYIFAIATPFWKRPLFWFAAFVLFAGLGFFWQRNRELRLQRMAQLQRERLQFEYEHLKSQVNPHFLFNSLNTLAGLIEEDTEAAVEYTTMLSDLYRDTLSFRTRDIVPLSEEWHVLERYLYIQKTRFGSALQWEPTISQDVLNTRQIIPLALQLLVENAIKHNVVSRAHPLIISVRAEDDVLIVSNPIRPKQGEIKSTGIGLSNIRRRYSLVTDKPVRVLNEGGFFTVSLPLL
jgi:hypothetical protein